MSNTDLHISNVGVSLIKYFEGLHDGNLHKIGLQPKMCPAGVWTVGYGYALVNKLNGKWLKGKDDYPLIAKQYPQFMDMTEQQAEELLKESLKAYENKVKDKLKISVTQHEFDSLVSHTYNTGGSDTLFQLINSKAPKEKILLWIETKYTTAGGVVKRGLVKRRKMEATLYDTGVVKF